MKRPPTLSKRQIQNRLRKAEAQLQVQASTAASMLREQQEKHDAELRRYSRLVRASKIRSPENGGAVIVNYNIMIDPREAYSMLDGEVLWQDALKQLGVTFGSRLYEVSMAAMKAEIQATFKPGIMRLKHKWLNSESVLRSRADYVTLSDLFDLCMGFLADTVSNKPKKS